MTNGSLFFLAWAHYLISVNSLLFHNHKIFPEVPSNSTSLVRSMGILSLLASPETIVFWLCLCSPITGALWVWVVTPTALSTPSKEVFLPLPPTHAGKMELGSPYLLKLSLGDRTYVPLLWDLWNLQIPIVSPFQATEHHHWDPAQRTARAEGLKSPPILLSSTPPGRCLLSLRGMKSLFLVCTWVVNLPRI